MNVLTRKQSQANTRAKLFEAALAILPERGLHGLSVRTVCAAAGFTSGAFYSNFSSRTVFLGHLSSYVNSLFFKSFCEANAKACGLDAASAIQVFDDWALNVPQTIVSAMLNLGAFAHSDAEFLGMYEPQVSAFRTDLGRELAKLFGAFRLEPGLTFDEMAGGFMTMWMGSLIFRCVPDHKSFDHAIARFLSEMLKAARPQED